ncbi:MAG: hypothetical protein AABW50_00980 [Nanoarchaeota archaeon]
MKREKAKDLVIYSGGGSMQGIFGRFVIPQTAGIFEREGSIHETESNKAYFVAEQRNGRKKLSFYLSIIQLLKTLDSTIKKSSTFFRIFYEALEYSASKESKTSFTLTIFSAL